MGSVFPGSFVVTLKVISCVRLLKNDGRIFGALPGFLPAIVPQLSDLAHWYLRTCFVLLVLAIHRVCAFNASKKQVSSGNRPSSDKNTRLKKD